MAAAIGLPVVLAYSWQAGLSVFAEEARAAASAGGGSAAADNSACFVCHADFEEEPLVTTHAEEGAGVGCTDCHGVSQAHADDEGHTTPPDVMFPAGRINRSCRQCHKTHDASPELVIRRWQERCPEKAGPGGIVCTDCHGRHRVDDPRARWDKHTGKLLEK